MIEDTYIQCEGSPDSLSINIYISKKDLTKIKNDSESSGEEVIKKCLMIQEMITTALWNFVSKGVDKSKMTIDKFEKLHEVFKNALIHEINHSDIESKNMSDNLSKREPNDYKKAN